MVVKKRPNGTGENFIQKKEVTTEMTEREVKT